MMSPSPSSSAPNDRIRPDAAECAPPGHVRGFNRSLGVYDVYDVTINGSLYAWGHGLMDARSAAIDISLIYPTRLVRVHDTDGIGVIAEFRNGKQVKA